MVDALSGAYQLKEQAISVIEIAAEPIIYRLYPDMKVGQAAPDEYYSCGCQALSFSKGKTNDQRMKQ